MSRKNDVMILLFLGLFLSGGLCHFSEAMTVGTSTAPADTRQPVDGIHTGTAASPGEPVPTSTDQTREYFPAFGIDYTHPEKYLAQGEQTRISDVSVLDGMRSDQGIEQLAAVYHWL